MGYDISADMLSKVLAASALSAAALAAPNAKESCTWIGATYGQGVTCPQGFVISGTCGSGQTADCDGGAYHNEIYCCELSAWSNCGWVGGLDGDLVACPANQVAAGTCG